VVGSNIFNVLMILGASSLVSGSGLVVSPAMQALDIPLCLGIALAIWSMLATQHRLDRWEGALLFAGYVAYVTYLVLAELRSPALGAFTSAMAYAVLPLVAALLLGHLAYSLVRRRAGAGVPPSS